LKEKVLAQLRLVAILEGISYLALLFIAMPMKYIFADVRLMQPVGMLHGLLFVLYVLLLLVASLQNKWGIGLIFKGFVLSLLPFGTFYAEKKLFR
jgi:integral membrane protein